MSDKIQIEADTLASLAQSLSQAASILNNVISSSQPSTKRGRPKKDSVRNGMCPQCSEAYMYCACSNNPLNKKKIEPSKRLVKDLNTLLPPKIVDNNTEILCVDEEVLDVLKEPEQIIQKKTSPSHIVAAKRIVNNGLDITQTTIEVIKKPGEVKFIDIDNVKHEKEIWEPSERRNPVKKMSFLCDRCRCNFEVYPSELPQAFIREKIPTGGEDKPRVYCESCVGIGK